MKKGLKDNEYLYQIAKAVSGIEFMFAMVIIAKVIFILIDVLNSAG